MRKKRGLLVAMILIIIIIGGTCILWTTFFKQEDMEIDDIIWINNISDRDRHGIYLYRDGKKEKIGDVELRYVSKSGENLLVGVQNLYSNEGEFKGIVSYNISSGEISEILACDKIYDFVGEPNHGFHGTIQMTNDGKFLYFVCGGKMLLYDVENDKLGFLFETWNNSYSLNEQETCLYFRDNDILYRYNLLTNMKDTLASIDGLYCFAISRDEKIVIYRESSKSELILYQMDTGEKEKLANLDYIWGAVYISKDNRYILYTDYKEAFVPTNRKIRIYVLDLETGKRKVIHRGNYSDNIGNVLW